MNTHDNGITPRILLVCASRHTDQRDFLLNSPLGQTLDGHWRIYNLPDHPVKVHLAAYFNNRRGLSTVYNEALREHAREQDIVVFIHDDVALPDYYWPQRLLEALNRFDIVGLAGCRTLTPRRPGWLFTGEDAHGMVWDSPDNLCGAIAHGSGYGTLCAYGAVRQSAILLDGLFIACRAADLRRHNLWFDERFDFHFYDLDFCRAAARCGLRAGVWDIAAVHASSGRFGSAAWRQALARYLDKWEAEPPRA